MKAIYTTLAILALGLLAGCNSGTTTSSTAPSILDEGLSLADMEADEGVVLPGYEDIISDHYLTPAELYVMDPAKYTAAANSVLTPEAANELIYEVSRDALTLSSEDVAQLQSSAMMSAINRSSADESSALKDSASFIICSANMLYNNKPLVVKQNVPWLSTLLEFGNGGLLPAGNMMSSYIMSTPAVNDNGKQIKYAGQTPKDKNKYFNDSSSLVYYVDSTSMAQLPGICQKSILRAVGKQLNSGMSINNVSYSDLTIRASSNVNASGLQVLPVTQPQTTGNKIDTLVVFGDSLSDTGALLVRTKNYVPNGESWYRGHFTNGWTWAEYGANNLNILHMNQAWGASGINDQPVGVRTLKATTVITPGISTAVDDFNRYVTSQEEVTITKYPDQTLYAVLIGANDFISYGQTPTQVTQGVSKAVTKLIDENQAKNIIIINLPDISKAPRFKNNPTEQAKLTADVVAYTQELKDLVTSLNNQYNASSPGKVKVTFFDTSDTFNDIMYKPSDYGIINTTDMCLVSNLGGAYIAASPMRPDCNGDNYAFWDSIHPTKKVHKVLGEAFANFAKQNYNF